MSIYEDFLKQNDFNHDPTIPNITDYYKKFGDDIVAYGKKKPLNFYWDYPFDWMKILTPIEFDAWQVIRMLGKVVLYPQYPVLNYRPDFANPFKKVILECDGKDFHKDVAKDKARDEKLLADGWHVYRVTGSELYKVSEIVWDDYNNCYDQDSLYDHYMNNAEGVIKAIRGIYFTGTSYEPAREVHDLMYKTLNKHRLVDFEIPLIDIEKTEYNL